MDRIFFAIGSLLAGLAVGAGAYGAHGGSALGMDQVRWIEKAARYQMYHSIALICVSLALAHWQERAKLFYVAGWLFRLFAAHHSGCCAVARDAIIRRVLLSVPGICMRIAALSAD